MAGLAYCEVHDKALLDKLPARDRIQVVVRCRPMDPVLELGQTGSGSSIVRVEPVTGRVHVRNPKVGGREHIFTFDEVFGEEAQQKNVYEYVCSDLVDRVLQGYNATIFAYGQTGSGKTVTMEGVPGDRYLKGLMPASFDRMFSFVAQQREAKPDCQYLIRVSFLELYQDHIYDLLVDPQKEKSRHLDLRTHKKLGLFIPGLTQVVMSVSTA